MAPVAEASMRSCGARRNCAPRAWWGGVAPGTPSMRRLSLFTIRPGGTTTEKSRAITSRGAATRKSLLATREIEPQEGAAATELLSADRAAYRGASERYTAAMVDHSTNPTASVQPFAPPRSRLRRWLPITTVVVLAYLASYAVARITGGVIHYENVVLAEQESWWRGHEIAPGARRIPSGVLLPWRPLMVAEEMIRGAAARLAK